MKRFLLLRIFAMTWLMNTYTAQPQKEQLAPTGPLPERYENIDTTMKLVYKKTPLSAIVQEFAHKSGVNIVLPTEEEIKQTATLSIEEPVSLPEAERYIRLLLRLAGYVMYPHDDYYVVTKLPEDKPLRQPSAVYVDTPPEELPHDTEQITAIYYLTNLKVPQRSQGQETINNILRSILPSAQQTYFFDQRSNAIIINAPADAIAAAIEIILRLDMAGSRESFDTLDLRYATARQIAKIYEQLLATVKDGEQKPSILPDTGLYFEPGTRIIADPRTNRLLIIGRPTTIRRIKEFTREYLDTAPESGKSILHVYDLQYLDAKKFAEVLKNVVKGPSNAEQARKETGLPIETFKNVIITAEIEKTIEAEGDKKETASLTLGGNRLLIAARDKDWQRLKNFISLVDKPKRQVIVEAMVVDLTVTDKKKLEAQTRNPDVLDIKGDVNFQTAHIRNILLDQDATTLAPDLLRILNPDEADPSSFALPATQGEDNGSLIISFRDPCDTDKIWTVLKVLDRYFERKIIAHPFIVTQDLVTGTQINKNIRRAIGPAVDDKDSVIYKRKFKDFPAEFNISVTPRIHSLNRLNMQIEISSEEFEAPNDPNNFNRFSRKISTNANLASGDILVIGGLSRKTNQWETTKWPIIGDLPIIGRWFKGDSQNLSKSNITIFLLPTIVDPQLRTGINQFTEDTIDHAYERISEGQLFEDFRDPITRFFFGRRYDTKLPDDYLDKSPYAYKVISPLVPPERDPDDRAVINIDEEYPASNDLKDLFAYAKNPFVIDQEANERK